MDLALLSGVRDSQGALMDNACGVTGSLGFGKLASMGFDAHVKEVA